MKKIEDYLNKISLAKEPNNLYAPIHYTLTQGGKRLRPRLVYLSTVLFGGDEQTAMKPAAAFEMLHNFTLIHDDIMDNADIRRGKSTVFRQWNGNIAILSGDALASLALKEILTTRVRPEVVIDLAQLFTQTSIEICEGQQKDLDFETDNAVTIEEYMAMICKKTAVMLAGCLKAGAIISEASTQNQEAIYQFGINLGLAFQLKDDLLDVYGNNKTFGKKIGGDIRENKKSYLYLRALQDANSKQRETLLHYFSSTAFDEKEKFDAVTAIYNDLQIQEKTEMCIATYANRAILTLEAIDIDEERKQPLFDLTAELSCRNK